MSSWCDKIWSRKGTSTESLIRAANQHRHIATSSHRHLRAIPTHGPRVRYSVNRGFALQEILPDQPEEPPEIAASPSGIDSENVRLRAFPRALSARRPALCAPGSGPLKWLVEYNTVE
jgi:hypothetical protein